MHYFRKGVEPLFLTEKRTWRTMKNTWSKTSFPPSMEPPSQQQLTTDRPLPQEPLERSLRFSRSVKKYSGLGERLKPSSSWGKEVFERKHHEGKKGSYSLAIESLLQLHKGGYCSGAVKV